VQPISSEFVWSLRDETLNLFLDRSRYSSKSTTTSENLMANDKNVQSSNNSGWEYYHPTRESIGLLIARLALGAIFLWSGFGKLSSLSEFTAGMLERGVPFAQIIAPAGASVEFAAALALILGFWTRTAASALAVFTAAATLIAHRFWDFPDQEQRMQTIQFMKNVAIVGGLAALTVTGGGRFSFDRILRG
jgi:putative oxidoreductase